MSSFVPDIPTVYTMTGFSSVVGAAILLWLRRDHAAADRAIPLFAGGVLAMGLGFMFFALRAELIAWSAVTLGYAALGLAALLVWLGTTHLLGKPARAAPALGIGIAYLAALVFLHEANAQRALERIVLSSVFAASFLGLAARTAHRSAWIGSLRSARLMRALLVAFTAVIVVRMVLFVVEGIALRPDGTSPPGVFRLLFAMAFGSMPFALTVLVLSISNSQLSTRLRTMASTDDLTGLVSRRSLQEAGPRLLERSDECVALMMIDLDGFKTINDRHGHGVGDEVLRHVAALVQRSLRPDSLIVRYGGDEFCALVPVPGESAAFGVAERLRAAMESSPYRFGEHRIAITMSIGVSIHRKGATLRDLLDEADRRAYRAKSEGRNRVVADDALVAA